MNYWLTKTSKYLLWGLLSFTIVSPAYASAIEIINPQNTAQVSARVNIEAQIPPNVSAKNMSYYEVNNLIDKNSQALSAIFGDADNEQTKQIIKGLLYLESGWMQFDEQGQVNTNYNKDAEKSIDYGLAQINSVKSTLSKKTWDFDKIQEDEEYNFKALIQVFQNKKDELEVIKKNKERWARLKKKAQIKNQTDADILLKAYNGFKASWEYVDGLKKYSDKKPWERKVAIECLINEKLTNQQTVRLVDQYQYSWDSTSVKDGQHQIKVAIPKKSKDKISVSVTNEDEPSLTGGKLFVSNSTDCYHVVMDNEPAVEWQVWFPEDAIKYLKELKKNNGRIERVSFDFDVETQDPMEFAVLDVLNNDELAEI